MVLDQQEFNEMSGIIFEMPNENKGIDWGMRNKNMEQYADLRHENHPHILFGLSVSADWVNKEVQLDDDLNGMVEPGAGFHLFSDVQKIQLLRQWVAILEHTIMETETGEFLDV